MSKKMTTAQNDLYHQTIKYLDIIVLAQPTINLLKTDNLFRKIFIECIGIVNYFETNFGISNSNVSRYSEAYYAICNQPINFDDDVNLYKNTIDLQDKVNYLNTYLVNKIGMNVEELENSFKAANSNDNSSKPHDDVVETIPINEATTNNNSHRMSDEEVLERSGYTMHDVADQLVATQASILLQRNIAKGKVFIYKSKPMIIPVIKVLTFALFVILMGMAIASYTVLMLPQTRLYYKPSNAAATVQPQEISFVSPFPYILILTVLFLALMAVSVIRNMKNDNAKFFMPWGWLSFFVFFFLVITLTANESQVLLFNRLGSFDAVFKPWNSGADGNWTPAALEAIKMIDLWKVFQYITYAALGLIVVCIVTAVIFNPKKDVERIQALLDQYVQQIRNGEIDTTDFGRSPFGGISTRMI